MTWTFHDSYGICDSGAMIERTNDGWAALPFGANGGAIGVYSDRDDAAAAAEMTLASSSCCSDLGPT